MAYDSPVMRPLPYIVTNENNWQSIRMFAQNHLLSDREDMVADDMLDFVWGCSWRGMYRMWVGFLVVGARRV